MENNINNRGACKRKSIDWLLNDMNLIDFYVVCDLKTNLKLIKYDRKVQKQYAKIKKIFFYRK